MNGALYTAAASVFVFASSTAYAAWVRRQDGRRADWKRIQELFSILENLDGSRGSWTQNLAVEELADFTQHRDVIRRQATAAREYFGNRDANPNFVESLTKLLAKLAN